MYTHEEITAALLAAQEEHGITISIFANHHYFPDGVYAPTVSIHVKEPIDWHYHDYGSSDVLATLDKAMKAWPKAKADAIAKQKAKLAALNAE